MYTSLYIMRQVFLSHFNRNYNVSTNFSKNFLKLYENRLFGAELFRVDRRSAGENTKLSVALRSCFVQPPNRPQNKGTSPNFTTKQWRIIIRKTTKQNFLSFMKSQVLISCSDGPAVGPYPRAFNSRPHYFYKFHFDINLPSLPVSPKWYILFINPII
jgi:hypothetical protein